MADTTDTKTVKAAKAPRAEKTKAQVELEAQRTQRLNDLKAKITAQTEDGTFATKIAPETDAATSAAVAKLLTELTKDDGIAALLSELQFQEKMLTQVLGKHMKGYNKYPEYKAVKKDTDAAVRSLTKVITSIKALVGAHEDLSTVFTVFIESTKKVADARAAKKTPAKTAA